MKTKSKDTKNGTDSEAHSYKVLLYISLKVEDFSNKPIYKINTIKWSRL